MPEGLAEREALVTIAAVPGIGPMRLEHLLAFAGSAEAVIALARDANATARLVRAITPPRQEPSTLEEAAIAAVRAAARHPRQVHRELAGRGIAALTILDDAYPRRLRAIELPPRVLFVRGDVASLEAEHAVAVVGTRRPSDAGRRVAARIASALSRAGALVVSGLAVGIDGSAHAAAVAEGGLTVGVIGGGHEALFPQVHDRLALAIVEGGGAVVSEHPPGAVPAKGTFPRRNRVISGLSDAIVVVEAPARSGALLTAGWALEQGRACFFVPGSIGDTQSAGCLAWLREYPTEARIVAGIPQLLEDLGLAAAAAFPEPRPSRGAATPPERPTRSPGLAALRLDLPSRERAVADALARGASTVDELMALTSLTVGPVLGALTFLEEAGLAVGQYGRYRPAGALATAR